jgi:hypothetical protein
MAAARFGLAPGAFALLSHGEQALCMDVDRVMRGMEDQRHEQAVRAAIGAPMGS